MNNELPAVDELGRRMQAAVAARSTGRRRRRFLLPGVAALVLIAAPATATVTGVFNPHGDLPDGAEQSLVPEDPAATGRSLEAKGYRIAWLLVDDAGPGAPGPTVSRRVDRPPPGTEVLAVLGADGRRTIDASTKDVLIEVAPAGSSILAGHR